LIILGNEIPVLFLLKHMPTLSSYEFKGFFLIFVATFMFGGGGTWRDNSTWAGWLVDFCGAFLSSPSGPTAALFHCTARTHAMRFP
jgi:hypothetical protein